MAQYASRILYCDDELGEQPERVAMLERKGFKVDVARNGATCLRCLRDNTYHALILDIMMPTGGNVVDSTEAREGYQTGLVVLRTIREEKRLMSLPVIVVTAYPGQEAKREIIDRLGVPARFYLEKPVPSAVIVDRLKEAVPIQHRE